MSESETGRAPPATCTYATRSPASAAHTGATWLWSVQSTTGSPPSAAGRSPSSSARLVASWPGVYGSAITCASSSAGSPRPRVRFA